MSALALLSPLALPLGRLGRLFLALGAFQAALKTFEARIGRLPAAPSSNPKTTSPPSSSPTSAAPLDRHRARTHIDRLRLAAPRLLRAVPKAFAVFALALAGGEDFSRPFGSDAPRRPRRVSPDIPPAWVFVPLDTYFDAWFLYLAFDAAMDLVAGRRRR